MSCSHWWHAPVYMAAAIALVIAAISSSSSSRRAPLPSSPSLNLTSGDRTLPIDLILALRRSGFHLSALILQISAVHVYPSTLFVLPDAALSNLSSIPSALTLFRHHTIPLSLPLPRLLSLPRGTCLPTLLESQPLVLTSSDGPRRSVQINGVAVSHPDLFVRGPYTVHGVTAPFPLLNGGDCSSKKISTNSTAEIIPWDRVVRVLGSKGYISFAVGLNAVFHKILTVDQVTVFAPRDSGFEYAAMAGPALEGAVKRHVAVGRFRYAELAAMHVGEEMGTLERGEVVRITAGAGTGRVRIDGVEITEPEVDVGKGLVVHGIARAFRFVPPVT